MIFLGQLEHVAGYSLLTNILTVVIIVYLCLHGYKVYYTSKGSLAAYRKLYRYSVCIQALPHHIDDVEEIGAYDIHLIDVGNARHAVFACLMPDSFALRLDSALSAEYRDSTVKYAQ